MLENDWIKKATVQVMRYAPHMNHYDASMLADDLKRSWPSLPPHDAVRFFFRPLQPQTGFMELS